MPFKILAIRATKGSNYLKNLQPHVLYRFTSSYHFDGNDDQNGDFRNIKDIQDQSDYPAELYDLVMANNRKLEIHITAVLGKNGSGKSSLLELLYLMVYCLAEKKGYIHDREFDQRQVDRGFNRDYFEEYKEQVNILLKESAIEVYYQLANDFYVLVNDEKLQLYQLEGKKWARIGYQPDLFFYSIVVNYSLYGLNSKSAYFWLDPLFHKNDGYKTPLVLNPFRKSGVIDVNSELHLAQTRILTNMIDKRFQAGKVIDDKEIKVVAFEVDPGAIGWVEDIEIGELFRMTRNETQIDLIKVFETFVKRYVPDHTINFAEVARTLPPNWRIKPVDTGPSRLLSKKETPINQDDIRLLLAEYIVTKIAKICQRYDDYEQFTKRLGHPFKKNAYIRLLEDDKGLIEKLLKDNSHITLKLKQAVNAYTHRYFQDTLWQKVRHPDNINQAVYRCTVPVKDLAVMINSAVGEHSKVPDTLRFIPAAMFRPSLVLASGNGESVFPQLSSGEQQLLHSIHCLLYHLLNIDTLQNEAVSYQYVNIVLDEIELYYHPEYQRRFIKLLRYNLARLRLTKIIGLNIIFSTHSPFILSDIPDQNVLKLENGQVHQVDIQEKTFGSNIHEMLARSFFLEDELIGAFAKDQIEEVIVQLNKLEDLRTSTKKGNSYLKLRTEELDKKTLFKKIDIIGERIIRLKLIQMYDQALRPEDQEKSNARVMIQELMSRHNLDKAEF